MAGMLEGAQVGSYRVIKRIGEGGMGEVWLAEHVALGRRAALKVLHAQFSVRPDVVKRFFNEARAATAINDPGIVQIFDFGQHTDGSAYIVMELLDGEPLDKRLARQGVLDPWEALRLIRQVATTLAAAHARGIVHRDLKPENIFLVRDAEVAGGERAKILDFGIAKLTDDGGGQKTRTDSIMGTPTYMSPEQCRGAGHVDQRSDVYALGCVVFTLVVGRPPFDSEGVGEIIAMHLMQPPPAPSQLRPGIPPELDALVLRCLAKNPAERFANAGDLAAAIGALVGHGSYATPIPGHLRNGHPTGPPPAAARPTTLSSAAGVTSARLAPQRSKSVLVLGGVGVAVVIGGGITIAGRMVKRDRATTAASAPQPTAMESPASGSAEPAAATPTQPTVVAAPAAAPPPDPRSQVAPLAKAVLARLVAWARDHAGAPCPTLAALGDAPHDPWGHPFQITCTDQPANQQFGAISTGPDGVAATDDDIASWQLDSDVTSIVRGAKWRAASSKSTKSTVSASNTSKPATSSGATTVVEPKPTTTQKTKPKPAGVQLDENGIPISR